MAPIIAMTGAKPVLAIASVGSSLIPETVRIVVGTLANHLDSLVVMAAPPLLINVEPSKTGDTPSGRAELVPEGAYDLDFLKDLHASGLNTESQSRGQVYTIRGTAVLVTIDPDSGIRQSVETPGIFDFATAY
jgi:hypothetical protein